MKTKIYSHAVRDLQTYKRCRSNGMITTLRSASYRAASGEKYFSGSISFSAGRTNARHFSRWQRPKENVAH